MISFFLFRVDGARVAEVGPDRACAEWLLRCGAAVKWDKGTEEWLRDYNSLPVANYRLHITEIDATDSAIMHVGFPHFRGLEHVKKAIFHRCSYMEDDAVVALGTLKNCLRHLQLSSLGNVTDSGILSLTQMTKLERLYLFDFIEVKDRKKCLAELEKALPNCKIDFPYARESDKDKV